MNAFTVKTKNGVKLYIKVTDDCGGNFGGYFCRVYLDEEDLNLKAFGDSDDYDCCYDHFIIRNNDSRTIEECCQEFAEEYDDSVILNMRMEETCDAVNDAFYTIEQFFMDHIAFNGNCDHEIGKKFADMADKMEAIKSLAQSISEYYKLK